MYPKMEARESNFLEEEESIYSKGTRERWVDEDAMTAEEDWLMEGWEEGFPEKAEEEVEEEDWSAIEVKGELYL